MTGLEHFDSLSAGDREAAWLLMKKAMFDGAHDRQTLAQMENVFETVGADLVERVLGCQAELDEQATS